MQNRKTAKAGSEYKALEVGTTDILWFENELLHLLGPVLYQSFSVLSLPLCLIFLFVSLQFFLFSPFLCIISLFSLFIFFPVHFLTWFSCSQSVSLRLFWASTEIKFSILKLHSYIAAPPLLFFFCDFVSFLVDFFCPWSSLLLTINEIWTLGSDRWCNGQLLLTELWLNKREKARVFQQ